MEDEEIIEPTPDDMPEEVEDELPEKSIDD